MEFRKNCPSPEYSAPGVRIKLNRVIQPSGNAIVISPNREASECPNSVDSLNWVRTIAHDVPAAQNGVITGDLRPLKASFQRFDVGMDVTQDEVTHSV